MSVNKAIIVGRLGKDPEIKYLESGSAIANFSVATDRKWKNKQGEKQEETEWHRCVSFGRTAEVCGEYLHKGSLVYIEGRLQTRDWEDKDGNKRYTTQVNVRQFQFLDKKGDTQQDSVRNQQMNIQTNNGDLIEDDIPF